MGQLPLFPHDTCMITLTLLLGSKTVFVYYLHSGCRYSPRFNYPGQRYGQWLMISPEFKASHGLLGTTFGGSHLACAAAIAVLDVMKAENLVENARKTGDYLLTELRKIQGIKEVRGLGLMIGIKFDKPINVIRKSLLFDKKIFTGVTGTNTIRLLPPLCLSKQDATYFLSKFQEVIATQE